MDKFVCLFVCFANTHCLSHGRVLLRFSVMGHPQVAVAVKNLPANAGDKRWRVQSLGREDPLEEGMATHSRILAGRIPMDGGAWRATVHRVTNTTQVT